MANSYSAPAFNVDTSCNIADLVTLKGSAIASTDNIYIYNGATLTCEQSFSILKIFLGVTSAGAAGAGNRYGLLVFNAGVTCTFTGNATSTNSGIQANPTTADTSSKGCSVTVNGTAVSLVTFTNSVNSNNTNNRWIFNLQYGIANYNYSNFNYSYTSVFSLTANTATTNATVQRIHNCVTSPLGSSGGMASLVGASVPVEMKYCTLDNSGAAGWSGITCASGIIPSSGFYVDTTGSRVANGTNNTNMIVNAVRLYCGAVKMSADDIRPTVIVPTSIVASDTGTGKSLQLTIGNIASYADTDFFEVRTSGGTMIARFTKARYVAQGNVGYTTPVLTNGQAYQIQVRASSDNSTFSDWSALSNEAIPTGALLPAAGEVVSTASQYGYPGSLVTPTRIEPPEAKVENGYQYGNPSSLRTGTLVCEMPTLPDAGEVWSGAGNYGYVATPITPTRVEPAQSNVVSGIQYGDPGSPKTGTYTPPEAALPSSGNVWNGAGQYGYPGSLITPTRTDATQSDVRSGVKYGDPNNQKTGTLNVAGSSPIPDPTAQRREAIIDNIKSTLAGIIAIGEPVANVNNSNPSDSLVVSTLGTYTHVTKTIYQVEVVLGGVSGVAKCTITDTGDGSDSVVGEQTITSGSAINLGTRGGQIKFTFATGEALSLGDKWTVTCDVYNRTIKRVYRARANGVEINEYPSIVISEAAQQYRSPDSKRYTNVMEVECEQWVEEHDGENIGQIMNEALQDMELALSSDPTRGGYAEDTVFVRNDLGIPIEGRPFGVVSLTIQIRYHQVI